MGGKGDDKVVLKPIKPLAVRYNDTRRTLKYYKEQLKMKSKRSRLLIMAIADKLNEKEMEIIKIRQECDLKLSSVWQQLLFLQGNLNKEQLRLKQVLQDKENIILSQRQEILRLRHALELAEKSSSSVSRTNNGSFRRAKRSHVPHVSTSDEHVSTSSTDDSSSPGTTPKQRSQITRSLSSEIGDSSLNGQDAKNVNLSRQKLIKGSERPKLKATNSNNSITESEMKGPKGILKSPAPSKSIITTGGVKPPIPSRNKVNEMLKSDDRLGGPQPPRTSSGSSADIAHPYRSSSGSSVDHGETSRSRYAGGGLSRDSGNSSLDSSDPSTSMEWKLSVRSTIPIHNNINNNGNDKQGWCNSEIPKSEKKSKPPPPPRRSKSYERPVIKQGPDIQQNYEEYDLNTMDCVSGDRVAPGVTARQMVKKVSFQEMDPGPLRRMPSHPNIPTQVSNGLTPPQVPARTLFFNQSTDSQPTFSSFKSEPKSLPSKVPEKMSSLDSSSVLSKLLNESPMMLATTSNDPNINIKNQSQSIDENLNITNIRGDYKYYF